MATNFWAGRLTTTPSIIQQVRISATAVQPAGEAEFHPPATTLLKDVAFHQAILSHVVFSVDKNGPVITDAAVVFYNDRFDPSKRWYFPEFRFQAPLQNSFLLTCWISGVDKDANSTYSGEATFTLQKNVPADVASQMQSNPSVTFTEIPLNTLRFTFTVTLADNTSLSFPCSYVGVADPEGDLFKLTVKLDQQDGLIRFYKFISNGVNASYCSIRITASYFGYTQKPVASTSPIYRPLFRTDLQSVGAGATGFFPGRVATARFVWPGRPVAPVSNETPDYITNDAMPFVKDVLNVNFDCHQFPSNYLTKTGDNSISIFACKPPFGDSSLAKNEYNKFHLISGSLAGTGVSEVYINVYNGKYLVIPEHYEIALDETDGNTLIPAAYLFTKIDVDNISNSVAIFKFNIAPAISGFQRLLLKKLLLQNTPASLNKTLDDIFVEFPAKIHQPELIQFDKDHIPNVEIAVMGTYAHGVEACNFLSLEFQNVNIGNGNAALIANMLKRAEGKMIETIVFDVDSDVDANPQASIVLSLEDITGKGLDIRYAADDNFVYLINKTLLTISASQLADKNDDPKSLDPPVTINPNQAVSTNAITDITEIPFTQFQYNYEVQPDYRDKILNEIRTDAGQEVKDDVIVTNNTGLFALYNIDHIDFVLAIVNPAEPDAVKAVLYTTNVISLIKDGAVTFVDFLLPVASYLSKWSVVYSTVIHFTDNTVQQNDPQHVEDINAVGKLINLTVSNLNLHKS
jgi:hypothetical protein